MKFFVFMTIFCHFLWGCSEQETNSNEIDAIDKEYAKALELVKNFENEWSFTRSGSEAIEIKNSVCEAVLSIASILTGNPLYAEDKIKEKAEDING